MKKETKNMIDSYYSSNISSQKLISYLARNELKSNEEIYCEYHKITNICDHCGKTMKYSGFKSGFHCTHKCYGSRKRKPKKEPEKLSIELILKNVTKQNYISRKFLRKYNLTEEQCYRIVKDSQKCKYCENPATFISWSKGYKLTCSSKKCINKLRNARTRNTNMLKYGVYNVSHIPTVKLKKSQNIKETSFKKYGVSNPSKLEYVQNKIRKTNEQVGRWIPLDQFTYKEQYEKLVKNLTKKQDLKSLKNYNLRGVVDKGGYHLDHIYSILEGFKHNVPIYIVSNINNLRMIDTKLNISKNSRCDITI